MTPTKMFDVQIADQLTTTRGAKTCLITNKASREPITIIPKERAIAPFGINSYEESAHRENFEIRCNVELENNISQNWTHLS